MIQSQWRRALLILALTAGLLPAALISQQAVTTYTGRVSDAMCGTKHQMGISNPADCTRTCVKGGSSYALVIGSKAYTLATTQSDQRATLDKYAGQMVVVKGTLSGNTLNVHSVAPAHR